MKDKPVREKKNLDKGLKRSVGKPACCVSKGGSSSNTASLPDFKSKAFKYLILTSQISNYLPPILLIAGLVLQYQSSCVDSKVLIGFAIVLGCTLLLQLASEIYERKVVNLVKTEGRGDEQNVPIGALTEKPSSIVNPDIVFSKMNDKFPLWYYQPKVVSLYIYTLEV